MGDHLVLAELKGHRLEKEKQVEDKIIIYGTNW